jgi:hypothetical protein
LHVDASDSQRPIRPGYLSAWVEAPLRAEIEELAARHDRTLSAQVRVALREHVAEQQHGRAEPRGSGPPDRAAAGGV